MMNKLDEKLLELQTAAKQPKKKNDKVELASNIIGFVFALGLIVAALIYFIR